MIRVEGEAAPKNGHSGTFQAAGLSVDWNGFDRLAKLCELAELTNNEARCVLLYCGYQKRNSEITVILGFNHRPATSRLLRRAGRKIIERWPDLDLLTEQRRDAETQEKVWVLNCIRNSYGSSRTPLYMQNSPGEYRMVSAPPMVSVNDLMRISVEELALESAARIAV